MKYAALANTRFATWAFVSSAARLPGAMAPLAMVFLGHSSVGGYGIGSVLAAAYILGEVVGAATIGARLHPRRIRAVLATGLIVGGLAFGAMAVFPSSPLPVLMVAAAIAGAAPAASPGALRSLLTGMVAEEEVAQALSAEAILQEVLWMAAPALVVLLSVQVSGGAALGFCAVCLILAGLLAAVLRAIRPTEQEIASDDQPSVRLLLSAWPIYLTSASAMSLTAVGELVLPALLQSRHQNVNIAAALLTAFAAASGLAAFVYGLRSWPGSARTQSSVLLVGTAAAITVVATAPHLVGIVLGFLAAGCLQSVVLITRSMSMRERLPSNAHAGGYSVMYAVQGVGYSLSAIMAGLVLDHGSASTAMLAGVALAIVLIAVSTVAEHRTPPRNAGEGQPTADLATNPDAKAVP
jgi:hypothetical protein